MIKRLLGVGILSAGLLNGLSGQTGESGVRSLNAPTTNPLAAQGIQLRFAALSTAVSPQSGYLLLEDIQPLNAPYNTWAITSFSTVTNAGLEQGESGVLALEKALVRDPATSNAVGVIPITNPLSAGGSTPLDNGFSPPADANSTFLHGRLLTGFGAAQTQNLAYFVNAGTDLSIQDSLEVNDGGVPTSINSLQLYSTGNGTQLSGVSGTDQNPILAYQFQNQDQNNNGVVDPIDPGKLWWETSEAIESFWRYTDGAVNLETSIGLIFEKEWPWVYAYNVQGRKWVWIYDDLENPDPSRFWAWNEDGYWIFFDTTNGRYYYRWDIKAWFSF